MCVDSFLLFVSTGWSVTTHLVPKSFVLSSSPLSSSQSSSRWALTVSAFHSVHFTRHVSFARSPSCSLILFLSYRIAALTAPPPLNMTLFSYIPSSLISSPLLSVVGPLSLIRTFPGLSFLPSFPSQCSLSSLLCLLRCGPRGAGEALHPKAAAVLRSV